MKKKQVDFEFVDDIYNSITLTFSKIQTLSNMSTETEAVEVMDIVEDIITASLKRIDEIREKAINEIQEVAV